MAADPGRPPFYARVLRLRNIKPGVVSCFLFLEGTLVLSGLLALAGLVSPWVVVVLPLAVAAAVKMNDLVAGAPSAPPAGRAAPTSRSDRSDYTRSGRSRSARSRPERSRSAGSHAERPDTSRPVGSTRPENRWAKGSAADKPTSQDLLSQKLAAERELDD